MRVIIELDINQPKTAVERDLPRIKQIVQEHIVDGILPWIHNVKVFIPRGEMDDADH